MAPENQGFAAFRGPVAGAAVLDEQAVPLQPFGGPFMRM